MERSPTETYRALIAVIDEYRRFTQDLVRRYVNWPWGILHIYHPRNIRKIVRFFRESELVFEPQSPAAIETLTAFLYPMTTEEERRNAFFGILIAPYPTEALARHIKKALNLTSAEAGELKSLADQERTRLQLIAPGVAAATIVGVAGIFASQTPRQVFQVIGENVPWLSWLTYSTYQLIVFVSLLLALIFVVGPSLVLLGKRKRSDRHVSNAQNILAYCVVLPD